MVRPISTAPSLLPALGGNPYRDGSYQYYLSEKVVTNDPKGVGAFLMASNEMDIAAKQPIGQGKTVMLDSYFNNEMRKDASGQMVSWHYKWDELSNGGFSLWGNVFRSYGVKTETLREAPTAANLKKSSIYIIVDPDTLLRLKNQITSRVKTSKRSLIGLRLVEF